MPAFSAPDTEPGDRTASSTHAHTASNPQGQPYAPGGNHGDTQGEDRPPPAVEPRSDMTDAAGSVMPKPWSKLRQSQAKFQDMQYSTPRKSDSHFSQMPLKQQKDVIMGELEHIPKVDADFLKVAYDENTASTADIDAFLKESGLYANDRWTFIPEIAESEKKLYDPYLDIIKAILKCERLCKAIPGTASTRTAIDTHNIKFNHHDDDNPDHSTRPDIAIMAKGPSFEDPLPKQGNKHVPEHDVGYCNVASVFDVKRNVNNGTKAQIEQLAVYIRQIFISQPNRKFCCALILTEDKVRLLHYDRSGAFITEFSFIHTDPYTFVRLVVGLSSYSEETLGLDTTIQWRHDKNQRKSSGYIWAFDYDKQRRVKFKINMAEPPITRHAIRGAGSVSWNAFDAVGRRVIIKDSWTEEERNLEVDYLARAKLGNAKGLVERLVGFEDGLANTKDYRSADFESDDFSNRTLSRMTVRTTGVPVTQFTSQAQAVRAFRDTITNHSELLIAQVLHREITTDSILIVESAEPSAILVNFGMALFAEGERVKLSTQSRTGSRLYYSYNILLDDDPRTHAPIAQDYLDDLESCVYAFAKLLFGFQGIGLPSDAESSGVEMLQGWETFPRFSSALKADFLSDGPTTSWVPLFWSIHCVELCHNLCQYFAPIAKEKLRIRKIRGRGKVSVRRAALNDLYDKIDDHYSDIIGFFNKALEELEKPGGENPRRAVSLSKSPSPSAVRHRNYSDTIATPAAAADDDKPDSDDPPAVIVIRNVDPPGTPYTPLPKDDDSPLPQEVDSHLPQEGEEAPNLLPASLDDDLTPHVAQVHITDTPVVPPASPSIRAGMTYRSLPIMGKRTFADLIDDKKLAVELTRLSGPRRALFPSTQRTRLASLASSSRSTEAGDLIGDDERAVKRTRRNPRRASTRRTSEAGPSSSTPSNEAGSSDAHGDQVFKFFNGENDGDHKAPPAG
ncbi:hypothetical protein DFP72DRAFT_1062583 [Ephemerocybe angulata]|uniref:Fungal-type protein kinase domain-containing protein n=1 Tax=Ephemerocybe angulata TaxID=980116 RepID=A0A8H6IAE6_9AGAR|nr:hypothetical protein DFP72DRAFT_1062583 [Tulosesus angulatus]